MIHTTVGIYANLDIVVNGVSSEHLEAHIKYNKEWRFGRALVVDGKCVYLGYFEDKDIPMLEEKAKKYKRDVDTRPYN